MTAILAGELAARQSNAWEAIEDSSVKVFLGYVWDIVRKEGADEPDWIDWFGSKGLVIEYRGENGTRVLTREALPPECPDGWAAEPFAGWGLRGPSEPGHATAQCLGQEYREIVRVDVGAGDGKWLWVLVPTAAEFNGVRDFGRHLEEPASVAKSREGRGLTPFEAAIEAVRCAHHQAFEGGGDLTVGGLSGGLLEEGTDRIIAHIRAAIERAPDVATREGLTKFLEEIEEASSKAINGYWSLYQALDALGCTFWGGCSDGPCGRLYSLLGWEHPN